MSQLEEQTFAAIDVIESTQEQDLLQISLEVDKLELKISTLNLSNQNQFATDMGINSVIEAGDSYNTETDNNLLLVSSPVEVTNPVTVMDSTHHFSTERNENPGHSTAGRTLGQVNVGGVPPQNAHGDNTSCATCVNIPPSLYMAQQPYPFNPYLQSLPQIKLEPFVGDPLEWSDWSSRFQFMIGDTQMTNNQKIAYLQGLTTGRAKDAIERFKCNGDLFHRALDELRQRFGQPT